MVKIRFPAPESRPVFFQFPKHNDFIVNFASRFIFHVQVDLQARKSFQYAGATGVSEI